MMNITNPYWTPPTKFTTHKHLKPIARDLGFHFSLPWPLPVTAGYYYGEQPPLGRRELVFSSQPEWFATDNILPSSGGIPLVNPYTAEMQFKRSDYTIKR